MLARTLLIAGTLLVPTAAQSGPPPAPLAADLVAAKLHEFKYTDVGLSGPGRVYVALSTLRKLGLRDVLERCDDGYRLDGARVELSS